MLSENANPTPPRPPRRSFRVSLEVMLAGLIALALVVVILAGVFSVGQRWLGRVQSPLPGGRVAAPQAQRTTPGLRAPSQLPQAQARPIDPIPLAAAPAPAPEAPPDEAASMPPGAASVAPAAPVAAVPPGEQPAVTPARPSISLGEYLGFVQFTKIRNAYLNRPDPLVNSGKVQRPQPTGDMALARAQGRLTPEAVRALLARRQAMQPLADLRSEARMNRPGQPATQPSFR